MIKVIYKGVVVSGDNWEEVYKAMITYDGLKDFKSICLSGGAVEVV